MARTLTITRSLAVSRDLIYVVTSFEEEEAHISPSRLYQYDSGAWRFVDYSSTIGALALYRAPGAAQRALCVGSDRGEVVFPHDPGHREMIVNRSAPVAKGKRLGRINKIIQIGNHLYACGEGGQVYRRSDDGDWAILDPALLDDQGDPEFPERMLMRDGQPFAGRYGELSKDQELMDEYLRRVIAADPNKVIRRLAGTEERMFAASSQGRMFVWNGSAFREVSTDSKEELTDILVRDEQVLVCGRKGAFMSGNERNGFRQLPFTTGEAHLSSMAHFDDRVYLASTAFPRALLVSDLNSLARVVTNLEPEIKNASKVEAVDDVLWVVGGDDIVRYDGTTWTRIGPPPISPGGR